MPKCCAYGIPNNPNGDVVVFTLCTTDEQECPQFAAYKRLQSWTVANCEDCKPPQFKKCCAYGVPNDPEGPVVRFTLCAAPTQSCPQFTQYINLGSWDVTQCDDCAITIPTPARKPERLNILDFIDELRRAPSLLEKLRELLAGPKSPR